MKNPRDIIIRPLITEKSMDDSEFTDILSKSLKMRTKSKSKMPLKKSSM